MWSHLIVLVFMGTSLTPWTVSCANIRVKRQSQGVTCQEEPFDLALVLDSSGSISLGNWNDQVKPFLTGLVQRLTVGPQNAQIGAIIFSEFAEIAFELNTHSTSKNVIDAINVLPFKASVTNTAAALELLRTSMFLSSRGGRPNVPKVAIVLTDGEPKVFDENRNPVDDTTNTLAAAKRLKDSDPSLKIFAIGVGNQIFNSTLNAIATDIKNVFLSPDFSKLGDITDSITSRVCTETEANCRVNADIAFIVDKSGSIGDAMFVQMSKSIAELIDKLNMGLGNSNSKIAYISFSSNAKVEFGLNKYSLRNDTKTAIENVAYTGGRTNTAAALNLLIREVFTGTNGDSTDRRNIAIIYTDGGSNDYVNTLNAARQVRVSGTTILVVAVTNYVNNDEVREMATDPDNKNVFTVNRVTDLPNIANVLGNAFCDKTNECNPNPCRNSGACLDRINTYFCRCTSNFAGDNCDKTCTANTDVVFAIDSSSSIGKDNFYKVLQFVKDTVKSFNAQRTRVGLLTFASSADVRFSVGQHQTIEKIVAAISYDYTKGGTNMRDALFKIHNEMFRTSNNNKKIAIIITDGLSDDPAATYRESVTARRNGITIFSIGVKTNQQESVKELEGITSDPDSSNLIDANGFDNLSQYSRRILDAVCDVNNCDPNPCRGGGTCTDLINGYECRCPTGRSGKDCERQSDGSMDLYFLIDSSGSIKHDRYQWILKNISNLVDNLNIGQDRTRVGAITFDTNANQRFNLAQYVRKEDVMHNIKYLDFSYDGKTNIADALSLVSRSMTGRGNVPRIVALVTDGQSTVNRGQTLPNAINARVNGLHIVVIALEHNSATLELEGIASDPDNLNLMVLPNYNSLGNAMDTLLNRISFDQNVCTDCRNGRCGKARSSSKLTECICNSEDRTGRSCDRRCTRSNDVAFVLDSSGSIEGNFKLALQITKRVVEGLSFAASRTQASVITYSDQATVRFPLNRYKQRLNVLNALAFDLTQGKTNTQDALRLVYESVFTSVAGDRSGVANTAILMSDGFSNVGESSTITRAQEAKRRNIRIIAVPLGPVVDLAALNSIASDPDTNNVFRARDSSQVDNVANRILDQLCN